MSLRKIIHIDMDAFYASVEQHDDPSLCGVPLAVGFDGPRGVVSTASYEARRYGVHSAMAISVAKRRCPELRIVMPRFERYKEVSRQVHQIFLDYTDLVEPISIDEAFLDVTESCGGTVLATDMAKEIKRRIRETTGLTASAGVSCNKLLAKIASDFRKPDGLFVVHPDKVRDFLGGLRVEKLWGVGPKTAGRMHHMGIFTGAQLREVSREHLVQVFGKAGKAYYDFARGIDERPVITMRERKSVGCEQTFLEDLHVASAILIELYHIVLELESRLARGTFRGHTLTLKVKWEDMTQVTRSITQPKVLLTKDDILPLAKHLLRQTEYTVRPVRLMGLAVSNPKKSSGCLAGAQWVEGFLPFDD